MGGALGILVGRWGQQLLPGTAGQVAPLDWRVLRSCLAVTGLTGIVFGIAPALRATGMNVSAALKETSRVGGRLAQRPRQVAAGAAGRHLARAVGGGGTVSPHAAEPAQRRRRIQYRSNLVLFRVSPMLNRYDDARTTALYAQMLDRLVVVPGVRSVALSNHPLLAGSSQFDGHLHPGPHLRHQAPRDITSIVSSSLRTSSRRWRSRCGRPRASPIATIRTRRRWPSSTRRPPASTSRTRTRSDAVLDRAVETAGQLEIVGVAARREIRQRARRRCRRRCMCLSAAASAPQAVFQVRTAGDPASAVGAIREAVRQIDPNLPLMNVSTQVEQVEQRLAAGAGLRAGVHAVRHARAAAGVDRAVWPDVVQRRATHERNRDPDGARRASVRTSSRW